MSTYLARFCEMKPLAVLSCASRSARPSAVSGGGAGGVERSHVGLGLM